MYTDNEWKFQLKLGGSLTPSGFGKFTSKLRIPVSGSILLTEEVREIIDTAEYQRLRGVRQLGPTIFVFPGANHTRFEHSLGVYFLSLKYLERILSLPEFRSNLEPLEKSIKLIVLSALLHDIGHYPYSHWVEEIKILHSGKELQFHEEKAEFFLKLDPLKTIIQDKWEVSIEEVVGLISDSDSCNPLLNSFINSVIDADKIDYLVRDSVHCGVNYGLGIDIDRIVDSLYINSETKQLTLTEKGRSALLSILSTRNIMYQEVYWHKTVRACESMFKRFFYEYAKEASAKDEKGTLLLEELTALSDDEFISHMYKWAIENKKMKLIDLIRPFAFGGRDLYKPAYVFFNHNNKETKITNRFFRDLFKIPYNKLVEKSLILSEILKGYIPNVDPLDILIEVTPIKKGEKYLLEGFEIFNTRKKGNDTCPSEIIPLNSYLEDNRQGYIFCHPKHYDNLKRLFITSNKTVEDILIQVK